MLHTTKPARSGDSWKSRSAIAIEFCVALVMHLATPARAAAAAEQYAAKADAPAADVQVDAREAPRGIMSAHLTLPVAAGPLTLVYPKWLPGRHSPAGPLTSLGGPIFKGHGQTLPWRGGAVGFYE